MVIAAAAAGGFDRNGFINGDRQPPWQDSPQGGVRGQGEGGGPRPRRTSRGTAS